MRTVSTEWRTRLTEREQQQADDLEIAVQDARWELTSARAKLGLLKQRAVKRVERTRKAEAAANAEQR